MAALGNGRYRPPVHPSRWPLSEAIRRLRTHYGKPLPLPHTDPFAMVLWESCAYLVDDERRTQVYGRLVAKTGADPERIAGMRAGALAELITEGGGMQPAMRAEKLQRAADLVIDLGPGELARLCRKEPDQARRILRKFRGIGEPGAEKILMASGSIESLGLESNGLRVLLRLGFGTATPDYSKTYRSVAADTAREIPATTAGRIAAHQLLRQHGKTLCKTTAPRCGECPLAARCPAAL